MKGSSVPFCDSPVRPVPVPRQPDTAARLLSADHSHVARDATATSPLGESLVGVADTCPQLAGGCRNTGRAQPPLPTATGAATAAGAVPPLRAESLFLSSILSGGPSPLSEWSNKTQKHAAPVSSSAHPANRRLSTDSAGAGAAEMVSSILYRGAHTATTSQSPTASSVRSNATDGESPYMPSRASETMSPEFLVSPSPPLSAPVAATLRSTGVSVNLDEAFFAAAEPHAGSAATLGLAVFSTPPKLRGAQGRSAAWMAPTLTPAAAVHANPAARRVASPQVLKEPVTSASVFLGSPLRGGVHHASSNGPVLQPHLSPLFSSDSAAASASDLADSASDNEEVDGQPHGAHRGRGNVQRSLFEDSPLCMAARPTTQHSPPIPAVAASASALDGAFGRQYALFLPASSSPQRDAGAEADVLALTTPSQTYLNTGVFSDDESAVPPQRQSQNELPLFGQRSVDMVAAEWPGFASPELGTPCSPYLPPSHRRTSRPLGVAQDPATASLRSLLSSASAARRALPSEMQTQVYTGSPSSVTPPQPSHVHLPHAPTAAEQWPALCAWTPRGRSNSGSTNALCATVPPQTFPVCDAPALLQLVECCDGESSARGANSDAGNESPHTPRGLSNVRCAAGHSLSASSCALPNSNATSCSGWPVAASAAAAGRAAVSPAAVSDDAGHCSTPPSPHTPLNNRTPGPNVLHENSFSHYSGGGHSHSRYRSQLLSQPMTPQKSARRPLSRQTTPSQSFRSKVQNHSFESQQLTQHLAELANAGESQLNTARSHGNAGESGFMAVRDYLAPSRNPFSPYRALELYATDLRSGVSADATPADGSLCPDSLLSEVEAPEKLAAFATEVDTATLRPDAAIVLYQQLIPPAHHAGRGRHAARARDGAASPAAAVDSLAALLRTGSPLTEHHLTPASASPAGSGRRHCRSQSVMAERDGAWARTQQGQTTPRRTRQVDPRRGSATAATADTASPTRSPSVLLCGSGSASLPPISLPPPGHLFYPRAHGLSAAETCSASSISCSTPPPLPIADAASQRRASGVSSSLSAMDRSSDGVRRSEWLTDHDESPLPRCPTLSPATTVAPNAACSLWPDTASPISPDRRLQCGEEVSGEGRTKEEEGTENVVSGVSSSTDAGAAEGVALSEALHVSCPLEPRTEGSTSGWSSFGSPNCLRNTAVQRDTSPAARAAATPLRTPELPTRHRLSPAQRGALSDGEKSSRTVAAARVPALNLTELPTHAPRLHFPAAAVPSQTRHSPTQHDVAGLRLSIDSLGNCSGRAVRGGAVHDHVRSVGELADAPGSAPLQECDLAMSLCGAVDTTDVSEEEVPGDRFQAHHIFQFLHDVASPTLLHDGQRAHIGDYSLHGPADTRPAIPLLVEVNGVTWLALHRLNGLPYAVKEVPATAFNPAELRCLTLSMAPTAACPTASHAALSAVDVLEAEDLLVRYYGVGTPPHDAARPAVHLLQLEYFPRGSVGELVRRTQQGTAQRPTRDAEAAHAVRRLDADFWFAVVTQGLRGLRVLHGAHLLHGCPLPLSLYLCGHTASSVRVKWAGFGGARADAEVYPIESLPVWMGLVVTQLYRSAASSAVASPDAVEVAVFCLAMLEAMVECVCAQSAGKLPFGSVEKVGTLRRIESVVTHVNLPNAILGSGGSANGEARRLAGLMRFLWDVSTRHRSAEVALAQLSVRPDPARSVVEELYEYELARLTRAREKKRQLRRLRRLHGETKPQPGAAPSQTDLLLHPSQTICTTTEGTPVLRRLDGDVLSSHSPHTSAGLPEMRGSLSSWSRGSSPQLLAAGRLPLHHTLHERPLTLASRMLLPASAAAATHRSAAASLAGAPTTAASAPAVSLRVDWATVDLPKRWNTNSGSGVGVAVAHRRGSSIHPRIHHAAMHMLEHAARDARSSATRTAQPDDSGEGAGHVVSAALSAAMESMRLRGWIALTGGVPHDVASDHSVDDSAEMRDYVRSVLHSLRPLTSFE